MSVLKYSIPGPGGSLGQCAVCGDSFLTEIILGQRVDCIRISGCEADLPVHNKCAATVMDLQGPWSEIRDIKSSGRWRQSMNLTSVSALVERLSKGRESRAQFVTSQLNKFIAFQIRALRDQGAMSQTDLAKALGTSQPTINRWESSEKSRPTITTLKKIAAVFDVGLEVRFVPFSKLTKFVSGVAYVESGMNTESFYVPSFEKDAGLFSTDTQETSI